MHRELAWALLAIVFAVCGIGYTLYHVSMLARIAPVFVTVVIVLALGFDFTNGIHDAANSIATIVSTRVLTPLQAVVWEAFFNFVAAYLFNTQVAMTIGKGVVHPDIVDTSLVFSGLTGAILWNLFTWHLGLPSSSSHALIGALAGAAIAKAGLGAVVASGIIKIGIFIVLSPLIGLVLGFVTGVGMTWLFRNATPRRVDFLFRKGNSARRPCTAWGTGRTTRRRRWESSPCCCTRAFGRARPSRVFPSGLCSFVTPPWAWGLSWAAGGS